MTPLLSVEKVSVSFGGVHALNDVCLDVEAGRVTGLIGPNGAGKTTLFNVVCGIQPPGGGQVLLDGDDITSLRAHRRVRLGMARTFQRLEVFGSLTARENVLVAAEVRWPWKGHDEDPGRLADDVLERAGIPDLAHVRVDSMPTGAARLVELARALATRPRVLLLDEPSSGLNDDETDALGRLLDELAGEGLAVLLVEHDVDLVMQVCRHIYVLDFGVIIAAGTPAEIQRNEKVQAAYLGDQPVSGDEPAAKPNG